MPDSPREPTDHKRKGPLIWVAFGLFVAFFLNVLLQRFSPGTLTLSPAQEALFLLLATGVFISACLKLESQASSSA